MNEYDRRTPQDLERALAREVSLPTRMRYVAVGLAGLCAAALITLLWATEPQPLPGRTQAAFAGLIAVGLAWAVLAAWTLAARRPLFARDRVLAARLALAATTLTTAVGTAVAAVRATGLVALATALAGGALAAVAAVLLARARRHRSELLRRRDELHTGTADGGRA
jgi:membrane associated rhomboid family serine protease